MDHSEYKAEMKRMEYGEDGDLKLIKQDEAKFNDL